MRLAVECRDQRLCGFGSEMLGAVGKVNTLFCILPSGSVIAAVSHVGGRHDETAIFEILTAV